MGKRREFTVTVALTDANRTPVTVDGVEIALTYLAAGQQFCARPENEPYLTHTFLGATVKCGKRLRIFDAGWHSKTFASLGISRRKKAERYWAPLAMLSKQNCADRYMYLCTEGKERHLMLVDYIIEDDVDGIIGRDQYYFSAMINAKLKVLKNFDPGLRTHEVIIPVNKSHGNYHGMDSQILCAHKSIGAWSMYPDIDTSISKNLPMIPFASMHRAVYFYFEKETDAVMFKLAAR